MSTPVITHKVARCRWCGGPFQFVYDAAWICLTRDCAERQIAHAVEKRKKVPDGESPYWFLPLPFQVEVEEHPTKRLLVHSPAGAAKSYFGRWYGYRRCLAIPGFTTLLLRNTYDQLKKNHLRFIEWEAAALARDGYKVKWIGGNVREFRAFHGNDQDAVIFMGYCQDEGDIGQFVGPEYDLILLEEGVTLIPKGIREIMARDRGNGASRTARSKLGLKGQTRILTNPGGRSMMYLDDLFIRKNPDPSEFANYDPKHFAHTKGLIEDNPYLDEDYKETSLGHLDARRHAQIAEGRWDVFEGQFFTGFDPKVHVQEIEV